jgi:hypothetical protein
MVRVVESSSLRLVRAVLVECLRDAGFEVIDFSATGSIEGAR